MALRTSSSVLSTIAAQVGAVTPDITVSQGYVSITGCPLMKYNLIRDAGFGYTVPVAEVLGSITVTPTATTGVPSTLVIQQYRGDLGRTVIEVVSYTPIAGDSATTICNAWRAQLALYKDLYVAGSGTSTFIVAASASSATTGFFGSAIITVSSQSGTNTVAQTQAAFAITGVTTATPMVVSTATTTGLVAGGTVAISGITTMTEANGVFIIGTVVASTSFGILNFYTQANTVGVNTYGSGGFWVLGTVPYTASTTTQTQGGQSRGYYWDLINFGIAANLITVGKTYNQIIFSYDTKSETGLVSEDWNRHTLFVQSDATNFQNFADRMNELTNDFVDDGTTADPLNAALI